MCDLFERKRSARIPLWRDVPPQVPATKEAGLAREFVFPSGRKALTFATRHAGLRRSDRIALPEWSSHCVISAAGWHATPVPMGEVISHGISVQAVLIYEQWGWPLFRSAYTEVEESFGHAIIIWDRVDTSHWSSPIGYEFPSNHLEVMSLSKSLGLVGGGLCRNGSEWMQAPQGVVSSSIATWLASDAERALTWECKEYFKDASEAPHPAVLQWVAENDIFAAFEQEKQCRRVNLKIVGDHFLAHDWPAWMHDAVDAGAAPGIVPLLREAPPDILHRAVATLFSNCGTQSAVYHFNWSGHPFAPRYEPCLAVPVHGQVDCMAEILETLERIETAKTVVS